LKNVRAGDVRRHQVRGELNPIEFQVENFSQRADQQRLGETWHTHKQAVTSGEQRDQYFFDDPVLADNHFADFTEHRVAFVGELFDLRDLVLLNFF